MTRDAARGLIATAALAAVLVPVVLWAGGWAVSVVIAGLAVLAATLVALQRGGRASAPIGIAAGTLLCVVVPFTFVGLTPDLPPGPWLGALLLSITAGARLSWIIGDGTQRLVESMVWTFVYVFLGLAPMVQLRTATDPATTPPVDHRLDAAALSVVAVGTAAFVLGSLYARSVPRQGRVGGVPPVLRARVTALAFVGLACSAYFVVQVGPASLFGSRFGLDRASEVVWGNDTVTAIVRSLAILPLLVAFVALLAIRARDPRAGWVTTALLPVCIGTVLLLVANPIGNARYVSGTVYLAVLAALGLVATRPRFRAVIAGFVAALILVFPLADAYRSTENPSAQDVDPAVALTTGDFDAYPQVVNTLQYVQEHGFTYGYQALGPLVFWVPRDVWPGKPLDTGVLIAESRGHAFTNLSAPLWSELFINGGWLVLTVGMFAFGVLVRRWDARILHSLRGSRMPGLLSCILPFYLLILLRGSLLQASASLAVIVVCAWFVRGPRPAGSPLPVASVPMAATGR